MPNALRGGASACYDGKIYVAGGTELKTVFNTLYIYDIVTNKWSSGPTLPDPVYFASFGVWGGKLFLVGGNGLTGLTGRVDVFDPATGIWTTGGGESMPNPVGGAFKVQSGPYLFLVGGAGEEINQTTTQRYDMSTNTWEFGPTFTSQRAFGGLAATNGFLYALGGDIEDGEWAFHATDLVEVLDLSTWPDGEWVDLGIPLTVPNLYPPTTCTETLTGGEIWEVGGGLTAYDTYTDVYYLPIGESCP